MGEFSLWVLEHGLSVRQRTLVTTVCNLNLLLIVELLALINKGLEPYFLMKMVVFCCVVAPGSVGLPAGHPGG